MRASANTQLVVLGAACFVSMLGMGNIVPFLPIYARDLGASSLVLGLIFSSLSASRALAAPYVGLLSDRLGRKRFLLLGLLGYGVLGIQLIWAATPWEVVGNRTLQGVFAAMILPISMAMVADLAPAGKEGRVFGTFNTWFLLGFGAGPLLGGAVYGAFGVAANFLIMGLLSLAAMLMVAWLLREPPASSRLAREATWRQQMALLADHGMLGIFLSRMGSAMAMGIYLAFLPLLSFHRGVSSWQLGMLLGFNVLAMTILQPLAGRLADRTSRLALTGWGQVLAGLTKGLMPLCGGFWGLLLLNLLEGVGAGLALPALTAMTVAHGRRLEAGHGTVMGLFTLALSLGVFLGPLIGGELADLMGAGGTDLSFYASGVMALLGAAALVWLSSDKRALARPASP
jgi:MFS family permease